MSLKKVPTSDLSYHMIITWKKSQDHL